MSDSPKQTLIAEETEFDGSLTSGCPVTLSGTVKGKLTAPNLTVTSSGTIHGDVKVKELTSEGEVSGNIEADCVQLSGRVSDNTVIAATTLEVKLNDPSGGLQVAFGNCELHVGQKSSKKGSGTTKGKKEEQEPQDAQPELTT